MLVYNDKTNGELIKELQRLQQANDSLLALHLKELTEYRKADAELRLSETKLKRAELVSKSGNWELHLDAGIITGSEGSAQIYGIEMAQYKYEVIKEIPLPEYRPLLDNALKLLIQEGRPYNVDFKIKTADTGKIRDIHSQAFYDKEKGILFGIIQDITERKQIEESLLHSKQQYDKLTASIPVGVYVLHSKADGSFKLDYASPRMAEMLDLSVESLLNDAGLVYESIYPDDKAGFVQLNEEGILLRQAFNWTGRVNAKGKIKWIHFTSTPEFSENGDILWHGLLTDITKEKLAEDKTNEANAEKDKFFSIIAHDLRGPIGGFMELTAWMTESMSEMTLDELHNIARVMKNSSANINALLGNLLEWSCMQRGLTTYEPVFFILLSKIHDIMLITLESANKKEISINYTIPETLEVFADENMLASIIRNLVGNAVKFTQKRGKIMISAEPISANFVRISITDTGIGMNNNIRENLFNIDINTSRKGTDGELSTGLGLMICKDFIEKHGGVLKVESEERKGSIFSFILPGNNSKPE